MVGVVAAVRRWMTMNHEERLADAEQKCRVVAASLRGIPGLQVELMDNIIGHQPYGLNLEVDPAVAGMTVYDVVDKLKQGEPPIWTRVRDGGTCWLFRWRPFYPCLPSLSSLDVPGLGEIILTETR